jgi:hypothetical protein
MDVPPLPATALSPAKGSADHQDIAGIHHQFCALLDQAI